MKNELTAHETRSLAILKSAVKHTVGRWYGLQYPNAFVNIKTRVTTEHVHFECTHGLTDGEHDTENWKIERTKLLEIPYQENPKVTYPVRWEKALSLVDQLTDD